MGSGGAPSHGGGAGVFLNVYDLTTQMNSWTYWCGVGVFHAGVEVYGIEYAFGGECSKRAGQGEQQQVGVCACVSVAFGVCPPTNLFRRGVEAAASHTLSQCQQKPNAQSCCCLCVAAGHDYDVSGVFATRPREAPGAGVWVCVGMCALNLLLIS